MKRPIQFSPYADTNSGNMTSLGTTPSTKIFKHDGHLHEEFAVEGLKVTITFDAALVTANVINGSVNGTAMAAVTFATSNDATMQAIATAIEAASPTVKSATVISVAGAATNDRVIEVISTDLTSIVALSGFAVTAGASQAGVVVATVSSYIYAGMPVEIKASTGRIQPLTPGANVSLNHIGNAIKNGGADELVTVQLKSKMIVIGESASGALVCGPVNYNSMNTVTGYGKYDQTAVTAGTMAGWALEAATGTADTFMIALKD